MIVCKFGGTSVADAAALARLAGIVETRRDEPPLVVVSALAGVTDRLAAALAGSASPTDVAGEVAERCRDVMRQVAGDDRLARLAPWLDALDALSRGDLGQGDAEEWMAHGELLSSTIVVAALEARGLAARWFDARHVVRTAGDAPSRDRADEEIIARLAVRHLRPEMAAGGIVVTQGYIASGPDGRTTLLGRGGSDLTASLLGRALEARRIEIWTDVDGILTGPPRLVDNARRLQALSFAEAAELAYFGARVLHPATLLPAQRGAIPVLVANARRFRGGEPSGTMILPEGAGERDQRAVVKSVASKRGIAVITVHSTRMLMAHGFLARIFSVFERHRVPVDLVSTSEVSVSLTVDDPAGLEPVIEELRIFARVEIDPDMAIVCVVGEGMRGAPGIPARIFGAVGATGVRMISQGASEINVSLVVPEIEADGVVRRLHDELFRGNLPRRIFGESFDELERADEHETSGASREEPHLAPLARELAARHGTPLYVYELDDVEERVAALKSAVSHPRFRLAYACKANFHPAIMGLMARSGVGIDAVSPHEVDRAMSCGVPPGEVLFTANNVSLDDILAVHDRGARINLGSLSDAARFARARPGGEVFLRINPGVGDGHHEHVVTGGGDTKFGIPLDDLERTREALAAGEVRIVGLHAHIGSGIVDPHPILEAARILGETARGLPDLRALNFGGGLGIAYRHGEAEPDLGKLGNALTAMVSGLERDLGRELTLWLEPGRYLVARAGTLVATVTCRKETDQHVYIGLDTGMNHLLRPALYGSYHEIENLSEPSGTLEFVDVVGNICESSDVFAWGRPVPSPREGHLLGIRDTGAYGYAMASHYNLWPLPREVVVRDGREAEG